MLYYQSYGGDIMVLVMKEEPKFMNVVIVVIVLIMGVVLMQFWRGH